MRRGDPSCSTEVVAFALPGRRLIPALVLSRRRPIAAFALSRCRPTVALALPRRRLIVTLALLAPLACLGFASSSSAAGAHHPTGVYTQFADCPLSGSLATICITAHEVGGEFVVGRKVVPIATPLTLQGGFFNVEGSGESTFIGAEDGDTLSKPVLSVPGGLAGVLAPEYLPASLRAQLAAATGHGLAGVTMTPELSRSASAIKLDISNLLNAEGVVMQLPLKIKLSNPFLGGNCYIGSSTTPILANLTAGATQPPAPSKSISGIVGSIEFLGEFTMLLDHGNSLVDNTFAVPRATGCGGSDSALVDAALDAQLGLPSSAGHSAVIMDGTLGEGVVEAVRASE